MNDRGNGAKNQSISRHRRHKIFKGVSILGNRGTICNLLLSVPLVFARLHRKIDATPRSPKKYTIARFLPLSLSCSLALSFSLSSVRIKHGGGSRVLSDISTIAAYIRGEGGILKTMISTRGRGANNGREEKWDFSWQDLNLNHV